jgi:hypothetical protein
VAGWLAGWLGEIDRTMPPTEYSLRQRVALVIEASDSAETLVAMADEAISHDWLLTQRISPTLMRAAKMTPIQLKAHGTRTPAGLVALGFNTLHLLDEDWCEDAIAAYGAPALLDEFLLTSNDAVVLAGSEAVDQLGINLGLLLLLCGNQPGAAREVLAHYQHARRVPPETLRETGLRAQDLAALGFTRTRLQQDTLATDAQLSLLGF